MDERKPIELEAMTVRLLELARRALCGSGVCLPEEVLRQVAFRAASGMTVEDLRYSLSVREQAHEVNAAHNISPQS